MSFDGQIGLYDLPGAYADRFDGIDYCSALDALAVPCSPSDLGLNPDVPVPESATEPVEWAGLQLELCINDVPDAAQDDRPTEEVAFYYNRYVPSAPGGGWVIASGDIDNEGLTGSVGWATRADDLSSAVSERLGMAIEGAVNGTARRPSPSSSSTTLACRWSPCRQARPTSSTNNSASSSSRGRRVATPMIGRPT